MTLISGNKRQVAGDLGSMGFSTWTSSGSLPKYVESENS